MQMGKGQMIPPLSALSWLSLEKPQIRRVVWVGKAWKRLVGHGTPVPPTWILAGHTPSLSKSIQSSLHQNSRGSLIPGLGKPRMGTRPHNYIQAPPRAGHPDWPSSGSRPHSDLARSCSPLRIGCSNLSSSGSLLRTGHPAGQTGSRMVPSLPVMAKTAFPKPALVTGIPSGSLSQEQVTRQVYTKTLASLAMSPLEIAYFPEFFWV